MNANRQKYTYFLSDIHLGYDGKMTSKQREILLCKWLEKIQDKAKTIYFVGDIFDYWFEYKKTVPKGYSDFFAQLKILKNRGVEIHFFTGNHDMWMFQYFQSEYGIFVHKKSLTIRLNDKKILIAHGDGLGPGDVLYKIIKKIFSNPLCQFLFSLLPSSWALSIMKKISQRDAYKYDQDPHFLNEKEWLVQYAFYQDPSIDIFIFGHRHIALEYMLDEDRRIFFLGDWIKYFSFVVWDGNELKLERYEM